MTIIVIIFWDFYFEFYGLQSWINTLFFSGGRKEFYSKAPVINEVSNKGDKIGYIEGNYL